MRALFVILFLSTFHLLLNPIFSQNDNRIILILDASGSMWGEMENSTKIEVARSVISEVLGNLNGAHELGLVAYGHREKGDCDDIEFIVEPGLNNFEEISKSLDKVNPVGKTPLASTATLVINRLKANNMKATVILVSDGAESCGGDLCEVIKNAKAAEVDFVLHVVGFDIGESDRLALQCAAKEGDGLYLDASNADELSSALNQATQLTVEKAEASLEVRVTKDAKLQDASVQLVRHGEERHFTTQRTYQNENSNPARFVVPSNTYDILVKPIGTDASDIWRRNIVLDSDSIKRIEIDFSVGELSVLTKANAELWDCTVSITHSESQKQVAKGRTYTSSDHNPMIKELNPGLYDISISALEINGVPTDTTIREVQIGPNEISSIEHLFKYGQLSLETTANGELSDCVVNVFQIDAGNRRSVGRARTYTSAADNPYEARFIPGQYEVHIKGVNVYGKDNELTLDPIEILENERIQLKHEFETGLLQIAALHDKQLWRSNLTIYQNNNVVFTKLIGDSDASNPLEVLLTSGTYMAKVRPQKLDAPTQEFTFEINNGDMVIKTIQF